MIQLPIIAALLAAALSFGFGTGWYVQGNRYTAKIKTVELANAKALSDARQKALDDTIKLQRTKDEAIQAAEKRAQEQSVAASAARADADRMRSKLANVPARIARATDSAVREYANAASVVFAECVGKYQELAEKADGHANDVRLMREAWPK